MVNLEAELSRGTAIKVGEENPEVKTRSGYTGGEGSLFQGGVRRHRTQCRLQARNPFHPAIGMVIVRLEQCCDGRVKRSNEQIGSLVLLKNFFTNIFEDDNGRPGSLT